jgi:hypothetical protein
MRQDEDPIERLARITAEQNDRLERQRIREFYSVSPEFTRLMWQIAAVCGIVIVLVIAFALSR